MVAFCIRSLSQLHSRHHPESRTKLLALLRWLRVRIDVLSSINVRVMEDVSPGSERNQRAGFGQRVSGRCCPTTVHFLLYRTVGVRSTRAQAETFLRQAQHNSESVTVQYVANVLHLVTAVATQHSTWAAQMSSSGC